VKAVAGSVTASRAKPSTPSPGTVAKSAMVAGPSAQVGKKHETTESPTANALTPAPTASTTPAPSDMGMRPSACHPARLATP